jgi:hypothetical protein
LEPLSHVQAEAMVRQTAAQASHPRYFFCPYYKRDSRRHWRCHNYAFKRVHDAKQHIFRLHTIAEYFCPTCFAEFPDYLSCRRHIQDSTCQPTSVPTHLLDVQRQVNQTHASQNLFTEDEIGGSSKQKSNQLKLHSQATEQLKDMPTFTPFDMDLPNANDTYSQMTNKAPPGPKPTSTGSHLPQPSTQMHASGSFIDVVGGMRRYQPRRKGHQQEPQKQRAKEYSVVPTISKDHTAGEQALRADLLAKLGRGEKRHLSTMHTSREQLILDPTARQQVQEG